MSSIMRRRRGLKSAISILLSEGGGLNPPHPLSQEAIYATLPLTPRQRLRSIPSDSLFEACALAFIDVFWTLMLVSAAAVPLALLLRKVKLGGEVHLGH